tara:strand:- start:6780 stop:7088 length:309 start_codon:yes stop_codon:yes gene_type:complete
VGIVPAAFVTLLPAVIGQSETRSTEVMVTIVVAIVLWHMLIHRQRSELLDCQRTMTPPIDEHGCPSKVRAGRCSKDEVVTLRLWTVHLLTEHLTPKICTDNP